MYLQDFFDYKNQLMEILVSNEEIVKLITDNSTPPIPHYDLRYTQIFPYEWIPETVGQASTFICFDVDILEVRNKTFYNPILYVWIFTHKSKLRCRDGGIRLDSLASVIDSTLNGSRDFGLGELNLLNVKRFVPIDEYYGRVLHYTTKEWNRRQLAQPVPINRKSN